MTNTENTLVITVADLTRSCCANENYFAWLSNQSEELRDSVEIAHYLGQAAEVFERQAQSRRAEFDELAARDQLADILMISGRLTISVLQVAVTHCIRDSRYTEETT